MRIHLVADALTQTALECSDGIQVEYHARFLDRFFRRIQDVDFLLVESAWQGYRNRWKYKIASYPDVPSRNNLMLQKLVRHAKDKGVPTVFWNKEDGVHFNRFIDSAKLFDYIFTVDENCIPKYRQVVGGEVAVQTLMFAVQPKLHGFTGFGFKHNQANFVGSYSRHIHAARRCWQDLAFQTASDTLGLVVVDRNSGRKAQHYRYPDLAGLKVFPALNYAETARIYKDYLVSLNVNTVTDSPTMFSRRLVEILACGGIAVSNPAKSVEKFFKDYCYVVECRQEMSDLFERLKHGPSPVDLERARAGAEYVAANHTWAHRLAQITKTIGL